MAIPEPQRGPQVQVARGRKGSPFPTPSPLATPPQRSTGWLCVRAMVSILDEASADVADSDKQDAMTSLVTEIVMCTKEKTQRLTAPPWTSWRRLPTGSRD